MKISIRHKARLSFSHFLLISSHFLQWALGSTTMNRASGGDGISDKLFQILKDDVMKVLHSVQFSRSVCPTLCDPMNCSTPGLLVHHQRPEFTQTHVHQVSDAIQPSHPLMSPSPSAPNPSQQQSLFQWVNSSHEVAKVLEFQLQHHSFWRNPRADLL